jgi:hypothetical protein
MGGSPDCVKQQLNLGIQMPKVGAVHTIRSDLLQLAQEVWRLDAVRDEAP